MTITYFQNLLIDNRLVYIPEIFSTQRRRRILKSNDRFFMIREKLDLIFKSLNGFCNFISYIKSFYLLYQVNGFSQAGHIFLFQRQLGNGELRILVIINN